MQKRQKNARGVFVEQYIEYLKNHGKWVDARVTSPRHFESYLNDLRASNSGRSDMLSRIVVGIPVRISDR